MAQIHKIIDLNFPPNPKNGDIAIASHGEIYVYSNNNQWLKVSEVNRTDNAKTLNIISEKLGDKDLNSIQTSGIYEQDMNSKSQSNKNYPKHLSAGKLVVIKTSDAVYQEYTILSNQPGQNSVYTRGFYNNVWSPWKLQSITSDQERLLATFEINQSNYVKKNADSLGGYDNVYRNLNFKNTIYSDFNSEVQNSAEGAIINFPYVQNIFNNKTYELKGSHTGNNVDKKTYIRVNTETKELILGDDVSTRIKLMPQSILQGGTKLLTMNDSGIIHYISGTPITSETDPTVPNHVKSITEQEKQKWNTSSFSFVGWSDNRQVSPNYADIKTLRYVFTSWANNNTRPFADGIVFNGYGDATGGKQNMILFAKNDFGIRQYQGNFGDENRFNDYVDYWHSGNLNPFNYLRKNENLVVVGFTSGKNPINEPTYLPYFKHTDGTYVKISTKKYVDDNFITKSTANNYVFGDNLTGTKEGWDGITDTNWKPTKSGFYRPHTKNDYGMLCMWVSHTGYPDGHYGAGILFDYGGEEAYITGRNSSNEKGPNKKLYHSHNLLFGDGLVYENSTLKFRLANMTLYPIGDDVAFGDGNIAGTVVLKGLNGLPGIQFRYSNDVEGPRIFGNGAGLECNQPITGVAFWESSSRKLKTNIEPYKKCAGKLLDKLNIVSYDRIDTEQKNKIGIIAEDSPKEFLNETRDAVELYNTIFLLVKANQELRRDVKNLKDEVNKLKERL